MPWFTRTPAQCAPVRQCEAKNPGQICLYSRNPPPRGVAISRNMARSYRMRIATDHNTVKL
ncbi:hypothetical protein CROQUDRAFT_654649 [Cronartium quercuum f. sp. fusiforme G11]|uniref:Uncharacterized protein n=1 Tax=Cronartium quercuum f. sp. fusiforme G11 TaxID=708437 RepID=A0A9P6TE79_9BASI|nr:hypothetical protein CROQUDRAFT_654649 [Cronartium quercuum f. sp. fusiforme G11]